MRKTHATTRDVFLVYSDMDHKLTFPETWPQFVPDWLSEEEGVDLSNGEDIGYKPAYTPQQ